MYGAGQGVLQGVQLLIPMLQQHYRNKRFDTQMGMDRERVSKQEKQFYDRLALDQAWKDGLYGQPQETPVIQPAISHPDPVPPQDPAAVPPVRMIQGQMQVDRFQLPGGLIPRPHPRSSCHQRRIVGLSLNLGHLGWDRQPCIFSRA